MLIKEEGITPPLSRSWYKNHTNLRINYRKDKQPQKLNYSLQTNASKLIIKWLDFTARKPVDYIPVETAAVPITFLGIDNEEKKKIEDQQSEGLPGEDALEYNPNIQETQSEQKVAYDTQKKLSLYKSEILESKKSSTIEERCKKMD